MDKGSFGLIINADQPGVTEMDLPTCLCLIMQIPPE